MFRTVLVEVGVCAVAVARGLWLALVEEFEVDGTLGKGFAAPSPPEILPLPATSISFVITGVFEAFRFVRLASATSGES